MKQKVQPAVIFLLLGALMLFEVKWVLGEEGNGNPLSSALTSPITSPVVVTNTPTPTPVPSTGNGNSGGSNSPASAPVCNSSKPQSAPIILSAIASNPNEVTLTWSKAKDPVTYYLTSYGLAPKLQQFGNPNVGGSDTTSYTIKNLSGGATYYFRVRAGNDCTPGDFSSEVSVKVDGKKLTGAAEGFSSYVLATSKTYSKQNQVEGTSQNIHNDNKGLGSRFFDSIMSFPGKIWKFFGNFLPKH